MTPHEKANESFANAVTNRPDDARYTANQAMALGLAGRTQARSGAQHVQRQGQPDQDHRHRDQHRLLDHDARRR